MSLNYPGDWKFDGVGFDVPLAAVDEFVELIVKISAGTQDGIEIFKSAFGNQRTSSSYGFAIGDLKEQLGSRAANAAEFVDNLWSGIEAAKIQNLQTPSAKFVNGILEKHELPLRIDPPKLTLVAGDAILLESKTEDANPADAVPRFVLGQQIGSGGFGVVYRGTRTTAVAEFKYAIKVLDPSPFITDYEKALHRFQREVRAIVSLQHRGIVPYYEAGLTAEKKPYAVMPLIIGPDLRTAAQYMSPSSVLSMFLEVTEALEYAHGQKVIHRDLKPTNIIVRETDGQAIILDFGAAYLFDDLDSDALTSTAVGTFGYIPKEVLEDPKTRSPLQDVYACGVMLYECFAGHKPDYGDYESLSKVRKEFEILDDIVRGAIARVDKRTASAALLWDELNIAEEALDEL
jgi:hypothetical protein